MTSPSIMAYVPPSSDAFVTMPGSTVIPSWSNSLLYFITSGSSGTTVGARQFNAYPSGDEVLLHNLNQMSVPSASANPGAYTLCYNGNLVFGDGGGSNSAKLYQISGTNLTFAASFGIDSSSLSPSTSTRLIMSYSLTPLRYGTAGTYHDYVVSCSIGTGGIYGEVNLLPLSPFAGNINLGNTTEHQAIGGQGVSGAASGTVFVLGCPTAGQYPSTAALGLYVVASPANTLTRIGGITPANVDSTWTHFTGACGIAYDQTDGNVLIMVTTTDAVVNQNYIVKLNTTTAAVMWTAIVDCIDAYGDANMGRANIVNSTFYYMSGTGSHKLYTLNTATGAITSTVLSLFTLSGGQVSDGASGSIVMNGTWYQSSTVPLYIGDYMGTQGNHGVSGWVRWFPAVIAPLPPAPSPPTPSPIVSVNRAWTYTQDGHTFYMLDLGAQGTFGYDLDTKQWSQFQTASTAPQWNVQSGVMWGSRAVGGDLSNGNVYELDPGATQDYPATDITHVVTGGLTMRSRTYRSCDAVRIAASFGELGDPATATFTLAYSDDLGQTWTTPPAITLTEGNYESEIAWRSLGSFAAPGRIFQLTDVGGFIRIDGCDAMLDNFDDDAPQEGGQ